VPAREGASTDAVVADACPEAETSRVSAASAQGVCKQRLLGSCQNMVDSACPPNSFLCTKRGTADQQRPCSIATLKYNRILQGGVLSIDDEISAITSGVQHTGVRAIVAAAKTVVQVIGIHTALAWSLGSPASATLAVLNMTDRPVRPGFAYAEHGQVNLTPSTLPGRFTANGVPGAQGRDTYTLVAMDWLAVAKHPWAPFAGVQAGATLSTACGDITAAARVPATCQLGGEAGVYASRGRSVERTVKRVARRRDVWWEARCAGRVGGLARWCCGDAEAGVVLHIELDSTDLGERLGKITLMRSDEPDLNS
jgi:hypothetical protein